MSAIIQTRPSNKKIPRATYRLQFNEHFRLSDAFKLAPYLHALGVSHLYASPLLLARPHSTHGYDVCDYGELNPELGTEDDFRSLVAALRELNMGLVVDIVPNHMGIGAIENRWWWDMLMHGREGEFADHFDVDWECPNPRLRGKVLIPVLDDSLDKVIERGELKIAKESNTLVLRYFDHVLPIAPPSLPPESAIQDINSKPAALKKLVEQQHYLLSDWRRAHSELNYRRFFSVTTLAGVRMEVERVFAGAHALIKLWSDGGFIDGLRVDHPDGLRDPEQYFHRLRGMAPNAWIVAEKILEPGEVLPATWPVAGTTGYDFLNRLNGLFIDAGGEKPLTEFYGAFTRETTDYAAVSLEGRRGILHTELTAEVNRLTELLARIAERKGDHRSFFREELRELIIEVTACLPVYRTYARPEGAIESDQDVAFIKEAIAATRRNRADLDSELFDFLAGVLLLETTGELENDFVLRFQQFTGAAMAKGVEDTAFYCYNRLLSLNEVGGDPGHFGLDTDSFHKSCLALQRGSPDTMLTTSTHDTKRSEDVRARLNLLSEMPATWREAVRRWSAINERYRKDHWPDRNAEYHFYQILVGAWPLPLERAWAYMEKAVNEAKQHTGWANRNKVYETALHDFVTAALADVDFIKDFEQFLHPLIDLGYTNSLAQTLVKLTAPGVPDIYQGNELWDFSLVDPDNRRPVDFALRQRLLAETKNPSLAEVWRRRNEGLPKMWLVQRTLAERAKLPEVFAGSAPYQPLSAQGAKARHAIAFMRGNQAVTIVPRLVFGLGNDWADTSLELPPGNWQNAISGEDVKSGMVALANLLRNFPVALLIKKGTA